MHWFAGQIVSVGQKSVVGQVVGQQAVGLADVVHEELAHCRRYQHHQ